MKRMLIAEQHKFYSMGKEWRSRNLVFKSTFQPSSGEDAKYYDGQGNREGIGKSGRNIHDLYETRVQLGHKADAALLLGSVWVFMAVGMATVNWYGAGGCVIQHANELK